MNEELRAELLRRVAVDQEARHALDTAAMTAADGENQMAQSDIRTVGMPQSGCPYPQKIAIGSRSISVRRSSMCGDGLSWS